MDTNNVRLFNDSNNDIAFRLNELFHKTFGGICGIHQSSSSLSMWITAQSHLPVERRFEKGRIFLVEFYRVTWLFFSVSW